MKILSAEPLPMLNATWEGWSSVYITIGGCMGSHKPVIEGTGSKGGRNFTQPTKKTLREICQVGKEHFNDAVSNFWTVCKGAQAAGVFSIKPGSLSRISFTKWVISLLGANFLTMGSE
jgi:hypothetical protein